MLNPSTCQQVLKWEKRAKGSNDGFGSGHYFGAGVGSGQPSLGLENFHHQNPKFFKFIIFLSKKDLIGLGQKIPRSELGYALLLQVRNMLGPGQDHSLRGIISGLESFLAVGSDKIYPETPRFPAGKTGHNIIFLLCPLLQYWNLVPL